MERRAFLRTAAAAQRVLGANDRVRVGLIGCGGRGRYVARLMREAPSTEFVAACDVYRKNAEAARDWAGPQARAYSDFRQLLEQKASTPFWSLPPTIGTPSSPSWPARPARTSMWKSPSPTISAKVGPWYAARRYNRLVQVGTQHCRGFSGAR